MRAPNYLEDIHLDSVPERFGITFETNREQYFYDRGTGKVIQCENWERTFIDNILCGITIRDAEEQALSEGIAYTQIEMFYEELDRENLLKAPLYTKISTLSKEEIREGTNQLSQLILELTEKCNLRCKYCIYNEGYNQFRNFDYKDMTWETAKKSIDYAKKHSGDDVSITFYGGEPLLNYNILKKSIDYSYKTMEKKNISISFTTNLTLMTKEKAQYFATIDDIYILCSFDGPKNVHNKFRVDATGNGSFDKAIKGLRYLLEAFGDRSKDCIAINTVICPPFCKEKYEEILQFFSGLEWLPKECQINYVYVSDGTLHLSDEEQKELEDDVKKYKFELIENWQFSYRNDEEKKEIVNGFIKLNCRRIHERLITEKPIEFLPCNGCCIPGSRRLYVTVKGEFQICEKMGSSIPLGNVKNGIDIERVYEKYFKEYEEKSLPDCSTCWASSLCGLCYVVAYDDRGINIDKKKTSCIGQKIASLDNLKKYHILLEEQPERLQRIFDNKK